MKNSLFKKNNSNQPTNEELSCIFLDSEIDELTDLLVELNTIELKNFLIKHKNIFPSININNENIATYEELDIYTLIAKEICSFRNTEQNSGLDYCFCLAKDAVDELGGDIYDLLEEYVNTK